MIKSTKVTEDFLENMYRSKAFDLYFSNLRVGVMDIETTGLSPDSAAFVLGGILSFEEQVCEQYFAETLTMEKDMLEAYLQRLKDFDVLITYNGQRFDFPFILRRAQHLGIHIDFKLPYNLDLYLVLNNHSDLRKFLPNLKQKTVENFMGLWTDRKDEISGRESVELYYEYLRSRNPLVKEVILLHNLDDLKQLSRLLPIIEKVDFHKAMHSLGFLIRISDQPGDWIQVNQVQMNDRNLQVAGAQGNHPRNVTSFGNEKTDFRVDFIQKTGSFQVLLPVQSHQGSIFVDLQRLLPSHEELAKYASFEKDFLILKQHHSINYLETNHFLKLFVTSIRELTT